MHTLPAKQLMLIWFFLVLAFVYVAQIEISLIAQLWLAIGVFVLMVLVRTQAKKPVWRLALLSLAAFLTLRYVFWRISSTISYHDFLSFLAALALFLAEIYGITVYALGMFVNAHPLHRQPVPLPADQLRWPTVDVLVPSYNEPQDMLEITLLAALAMRYPKEKLRVCLLDDGGTLQKRGDSNPAKAAEALQRHLELQALCERIGASYITRERNLHAKAGNINSALEFLNGELVLILDADHVPTVDLLENTVGLFVEDEKMFLVQTPHFFINPDPVERNLSLFSEMPSENEMFYRVIQHGLDFWNSAFFCGSAAVLRRKYLNEIGGISGQSITEDAETALTLHARGYRSAYIGRPMIAGLQPETYTGFVVQRVRWAQGMVQILLLKNPLLEKGLAPWQRLSYFSSAFFWFFAYARVIFVLSPAMYLIFGMQIYDATLLGFFAYGLPHVVAAMYISDFLFGKVRWAFISELYELMQAFYSLPGIVRVIRSPRSPSFMVTPKGEQLDSDFISKLSGPFYTILIITIVSLVFGIYRYFAYPLDHDVVVITMGWEIFNLSILLGALGALYERRQRRAHPRMPAQMGAEIRFGVDSGWVSCRVDDLSVGGLNIRVLDSTRAPSATLGVKLRIYNAALGRISEISLSTRSCIHNKEKNITYLGMAFDTPDDSVKSEVISLVLGDSQRWVNFLEGRSDNRKTILHAYFLLIKVGSRNAIAHGAEISRIGLIYMINLLMLVILCVFERAVVTTVRIRDWALCRDGQE
jgi:cellulose synthase (UDP-forming)